MQFEVLKSVLLKAISNVNGVVEKRNTVPVLQNVKIDVGDNLVTFSATDMDIIVTSNFTADVKSGGSTTVSAQMLFDIVRKIPDAANIVIAIDKPNSIQIQYGKSKYNLPTIDSSEFPNLAEGELTNEIEIESEHLIRMIDKTRFAISTDETRYYLNGVYLQSLKKGNGFELRTVATDGHRMALSHALPAAANAEFGVILPKKSVAEIRRIVDIAKKVKISVSRVKVKVVAEQTTIVSKVIDGEFPDYNRVLPKGNDQIVAVNRKSLFDCVDRVSTVATDKHKSVKVHLTNGKMSFQVTTNEGGFAYEEIDVNYSGSEINSGFNSRYLLDVLNQIDKEEFLIK